jgi:hypothetical protein
MLIDLKVVYRNIVSSQTYNLQDSSWISAFVILSGLGVFPQSMLTGMDSLQSNMTSFSNWHLQKSEKKDKKA